MEKKTAAILIVVIVIGGVAGFLVYDHFGHGTLHDPIEVSRNSGFGRSWTGNGMASSPYVVSGLSIDGKNDAAILIMNTDAYFVIQNCYIRGIDGIKLMNVANGAVINCEFVPGLAGTGIFCSQIDHCTFSGNTLSGQYTRIYVGGGGTDVVVTGNTVTGGTVGIDISDMNGLVCQSNTIQNCETGIRISGCSGDAVSGNIIEGCSGDGLVIHSDGMTVSGNTVSGNSDNGIKVWNCDNVNVDNNTVFSNGKAGILVEGYSGTNRATSCVVSNNEVYDNGASGIIFELTSLCEASNNHIYDNEDYGVLTTNSTGSAISDNTYENNGLGDRGFMAP